MLTLSASGGHTELWLRTAHTRGTLLGRTRDDAAGEAFDKGAQLLGLPYPGGPAIARLAQTGNPHTHAFPLPLSADDTLDFSFSGLKTALRYLLQRREAWTEPERVDIAASYQHALCRHLTDRLIRAARLHPEIREVHLVGGVSANESLRRMVRESVPGLTVRTPSKLSYCTDNAAMIAAAATFLVQEQGPKATAWVTEASLPLAAAMERE